jgi:hypothetical protein
MSKVREKKKEDKKTKSTVFIRCMLGYNPTFYGQCFSDTYITIEPNMIVLVFNKANTQRELDISTKVYDILKENSNFIEYSDTSFYDIFKFKVPDKYKADFELYIDGKYSKMSNEYKTALLNLYTQFSEIRTDLYHILYPTERERRLLERRLAVRLPEDAEIFSSIEFREEIYDEDNFI